MTDTRDYSRASGRLPSWMKKRIPAGREAARVRELLKGLRLNTVCQSALCPNMVECFHLGTATFLVMGDVCTRNCRFCAVEKGAPAPLSPTEPARIAEAVRALRLSHVVVTSVTRDDLADGGAAHFAEIIRAIKAASDAAVEVLVPDFSGSRASVETVIAARPDVFNHNIETVARLYDTVRPMADYRQSLEVLRAAAEIAASQNGHSAPLATKSGLMVGLGETRDEIAETLRDLREVRCDIVTIGQYLAPSKAHLPVVRFVTPEEFDRMRELALSLGFRSAFCGPLVRSSYHAGEVFNGRKQPAACDG